jgi:hypothetical protein
VPQSKCRKCDSCDAQYQLNADHSSVSLPFRYYVKNSTSPAYASVQDITFYAKWQSCGILQSGGLSFTDQTVVHKTGNVNFPFAKGNKSATYTSDGSAPFGIELMSDVAVNALDDDSSPTDDDYYYSYGVLTPQNISAHKNNALSITLSTNIGPNSASSLNYSNSMILNMTTVPEGDDAMCFSLVCGALDYFMDKSSAQSSSAVEVLSSSGSPFVQLQGSLVQTSDTVTGTCTATVYGSPMPFFFSTTGVTQSPSYLCTAKSTLAQITSLSFANLLIAFGVMNFAAKAANRISKVGWSKFLTSCGAEVLDI